MTARNILFRIFQMSEEHLLFSSALFASTAPGPGHQSVRLWLQRLRLGPASAAQRSLVQIGSQYLKSEIGALNILNHLVVAGWSMSVYMFASLWNFGCSLDTHIFPTLRSLNPWKENSPPSSRRPSSSTAAGTPVPHGPYLRISHQNKGSSKKSFLAETSATYGWTQLFGLFGLFGQDAFQTLDKELCLLVVIMKAALARSGSSCSGQ